jgi:hypothetical protein
MVCEYLPCGKEFTPIQAHQRFCRRKCNHLWHRDKVEHPNETLDSTSVGAAHELIVCADLLKKGMAVYRTVSGSFVDLVVFRGDRMWRVEVTTGYRMDNGTTPIPMRKMKESHKFDVLAIVHWDNRILYEPTDWLDDTQSTDSPK